MLAAMPTARTATRASSGPQVRLPYPHRGQRIVRSEARRLNWLSAGRRWRKSTLLMAVAVEQAMAGKVGLWGAPTYDQVRIGWRETYHAAATVAQFHKAEMTVSFPTGGRIVFRSLDNPDNARGHTCDFVLVDEAGDVDALAWYEVLRPMLIDTGGSAWIVGTPKGRNWFWREWLAAKEREDSRSWQAPTVGCRITADGELERAPHPLENPDIPWPEIVQLFATVGVDTFKQEILAEFLESEGAVFRNLLACMGAPAHPTPAEHAGHSIVAGIDWGKQADYTCVSVGCATCHQELARDRFNKIDYAFQRDRLKALLARWGKPSVLAESNAIGQPNLEMLHRDGLTVRGFETTATTKPPLIENLSLVFERAEWQFQPDPIWTGELEAYERKVTATTGRSTYSAPEGLHDDTVVARALMVWQARHKGVLLA